MKETLKTINSMGMVNTLLKMKYTKDNFKIIYIMVKVNLKFLNSKYKKYTKEILKMVNIMVKVYIKL